MNKQGQIKELYEICHKDYDKHMIKTSHYIAQEKILNLITNQVNEPILDLACGTGFLINLLSKKFSKIQGNDFSKSMTEIARKNSKLKFSNEDAEILPSYDQKFKTIICCNLFFYLQNRKKAINRWANLLENDGKIIFIEEYPFIKPSGEQMDKHAAELMSLINPISPDDIIELMSQNGFLLVKNVNTAIDNKHNLYGLVFSLR